jgi:hypothetical protein
MEGRQFDKWTRTIARASRRDSVKLLLASVIAAPVAIAGGRSALAEIDAAGCGKKGDGCDNNNDCCDKFRCKNGRCKDKNNNNNNGCGKKGDGCDNNNDCCNNFRCKNGSCKDDNNNNNNGCGKDGDSCNDNGDCCNNFKCKNDRCR